MKSRLDCSALGYFKVTSTIYRDWNCWINSAPMNYINSLLLGAGAGGRIALIGSDLLFFCGACLGG